MAADTRILAGNQPLFLFFFITLRIDYPAHCPRWSMQHATIENRHGIEADIQQDKSSLNSPNGG